MDKTKHRASFPPPVFKSRVLCLRLLAESLGLRLRFVWDEERGAFVLSDRDREAAKKLWEQDREEIIGD